MYKDYNKSENSQVSSENIKGALTSRSFQTYTLLRNPKKKFNLRVLTLYFFIITLLIASALIFAYTIKTAYSSPKIKTEPDNEYLNTIRSNYENNEIFKVENVSKEISGLFNVPTGVKIVEIDEPSPLYNGLKVNDIIVEISGKSINSIKDMEKIIQHIDENNYIFYTVYRNGVFKTINPYEEQTNE